MQFTQRTWIVIFSISFFITVPCLVAQAQDQKEKQTERKRSVGRYDRYVDGLLQQYDVNRDGFLDANELQKMRRPPNAEYDLDSDGRFSKEELKGEISGASPRTTRKVDESTQKPDQDSSHRQMLSGLISGSAEDVNELMKQLGAQTRRTTSKSSLATGFVEFDLLELSADASPDDFKDAVEKLNSATSDVDSLVSRIANHQLVKNRDSLNFAVISGKKSVMRSGGRVTIPYGVDSQSRSNSYSVENVGFELAVQPDVMDDQVVLRFEASKTGLENKIVRKSAYDVGVKGTVRVEQHSDVGVLVLSGDENDVKKVEDLISQTLPGLPSLKTFEFQSTMVCADGQASAALFCESDRNWMLIVRAHCR